MRSIEFHILLALASEERHGYAILQEIAALTLGERRRRGYACGLSCISPRRAWGAAALARAEALAETMRARRAAGATSFGVRVPALVDTIRNAAAEWPESAGSRQSPDERAKGR